MCGNERVNPFPFGFPTSPNGKIALVFGNEGDGVGAEVAAVCDMDVKLPMADVANVDSVSVNVAAGVALFICGAAAKAAAKAVAKAAVAKAAERGAEREKTKG